MSIIFQHLATTPAPRPSTNHPLVLNNVDLKALPLDPPMYLSVAIDSVAPIFRIRSQRGAAGGGVALQIPVPLFQRQRRRTAVMWILDQVDKKKGGTSPFAKRFAEEIVAVVEGRSPVWERRTALHALTIRSRVNIGTMQRRR